MSSSLPDAKEELNRLRRQLAAEREAADHKPFTVANGWAICPQCRQSCTGKYLGLISCGRCGWNTSGHVVRMY